MTSTSAWLRSGCGSGASTSSACSEVVEETSARKRGRVGARRPAASPTIGTEASSTEYAPRSSSGARASARRRSCTAPCGAHRSRPSPKRPRSQPRAGRHAPDAPRCSSQRSPDHPAPSPRQPIPRRSPPARGRAPRSRPPTPSTTSTSSGVTEQTPSSTSLAIESAAGVGADSEPVRELLVLATTAGRVRFRSTSRGPRSRAGRGRRRHQSQGARRTGG